MIKTICCALLCALAVTPAQAADLVFPQAATTDAVVLASSMPELAQRALAIYSDADHDRYLDTLSRLQMAAGEYAEASKTLSALRALRQSRDPDRLANDVQYEVYAAARLMQQTEKLPFDQAFGRAYSQIIGGLDDITAASQAWWVFGSPLSLQQDRLRAALDQQRGKPDIALADAVDLMRRYLAVQVYQSFQSLLPGAQDEDDRRRYIVEKDVLVKTPDGAAICTLVIRPRKPTGRITALLEFSIYADRNRIEEARLTAAHGYAGIAALTRGKACSPDKPVPIEHDGADADAVIDWISHQTWSDGRVGMFGGSYDGFAQWAAAKHMPKALRALMPSVSFAPGVDFPMEGNVFMNYAYPWPLYTTDSKGLDDTTYYDDKRWERLDHDWYISGRAYRALDEIDGTPNPVWHRWLNHPSYDSYWRDVKPYGRDFARIGIPVLTTTGYYDSGQIGALYYYTEHYKYLPDADHYLVIGPYDHIRGQRGTISPLGTTLDTLRGYTLDPVAQIDILKLRYQWFDYVFRGGPRPAILQDKVNYEVMGANLWRHAPSLDAMATESLRFHLTSARSGTAYRLNPEQPQGGTPIDQTVDLADRSDADQMSPKGSLIDQALDDWNIISPAANIGHSIEFISEPFTNPIEVSGLFSGQVDFIANKKDFDLSVTLFELTPKGEYFQLSYYWTRASFAEDRSHRHLLVPGEHRRLAFKSGRLTSRQLQPGSRLVVVLGIIKQPGEQIDYGTGKDVSDETIADAGVPLDIQWLDGSFIDIPARKLLIPNGASL